MSLVSPNHGMHVVMRAKREFKENASLAPSEELDDSMKLARALLDSLSVQTVTTDLRNLALPRSSSKDEEKSKNTDDFW